MVLVALSSGHGLSTAGKRSPNGMREHEFNSRVVYWLDIYLRYNGIKTLIVNANGTNEDTPLKTRTDRANRAKADLYFSVHANANTGQWNNANGVEVLAYNRDTSYKYAEIVLKHLLKGTVQRNRGVKIRPDLWELRATTMPAVLIESAFMDNKKEAELLLSEKFRKETARECAVAICEIFNIQYKEYGEVQKKVETPIVPNNSKRHKVVNGDTLWGLSRKYNTSVAQLKKWNNLATDVISIGQLLNVSEPNKIQIVEITGDVWLHKTPDFNVSSRDRVLEEGSKWKMHGEVNGMYDLGGKYVSKKYAKIIG